MKYIIATLASHSCLQILKGAKDEGFTTLAISTPDRIDFYNRFKFIDEIVSIEKYTELYNIQNSLKKRNVIIIPHGSFVAYLGDNYAQKLKLHHFGNKKVLSWESDRLKQRLWLQKAGLKLPKLFKSLNKINRLVIVKLYGAKGGSGYFLSETKKDIERKIKKFTNQKYVIQEYIIGVPVYLQYFYSLLHKEIELMGIDKRYESNVDGIGRIPSHFQDKVRIDPSYTVIGNSPLVIRESLLPEVYKMGQNTVEASKKLISSIGLYGPFCLETIVTPDGKFYLIEISSRIVAGSNLFNQGSSYSDYHFNQPMSTGRRIAREIKEAIEIGRLTEILN